jgi:hypothetical protein
MIRLSSVLAPALFLIGVGCLFNARADNFLLLGVGGGGNSAPPITLTVIGTNTNFAGGNTVTTTTDCPTGSALFIFAEENDTDVNLAAVSDGHSNTYTLFQNTPTAALFNSAIGYSLNTGNDVPIGSTLTCIGGGGLGCFVQAAACAQGANPGIDKTNSLAQTSPASSFSIATGTLTSPNEIVFGAFSTSNSNVSPFTQATGFTTIWNVDANTGQSVAYKIVSATTSVPYNPSGFAVSDVFTAVVTSFKH